MTLWYSRSTRSRCFRLLVAAFSWVVSSTLHAAPPTASELELFEKEIRPIFVAHCYECHDQREVSGGLRLDSSAGWLGGGDSGPAVVAGDAEKSLLIEAIRYDAGIQMPPTGKLPPEKISLLEQWVARGAPAPLDPEFDSQKVSLDLESGRQFWAYQPVKEWPIPTGDESPAAQAPLDRFVFARLKASGVPHAPEAERAVLVRRLYFDLLGLPPTPDEIDRFLNDDSPIAYESLVDRLLTSPRFGERWGRHWLDVVRFAESLTLRGFILPEAWRYRDYVVESFNRDRPYDEFLRQQIAGDLLSANTVAARQQQLVATTFLALGNTNLEEQDKRQLDMDVVDEQLDVIGKALLGQTIGCARCHDHKFDPIPTRDYYALAGILASTKALEHANVSQWMEVPLPLPADEEERLRSHEEAVAALERQIEQVRGKLAELTDTELDQQSGPSVVAVKELAGIVIDDRQAKKVGTWAESTHTRPYIGDGYVHDLDEHKGEKTLTFVPELPRTGQYEVRLAYTPGSNRAARVSVTVFSANGERTLHIDMRQPPPVDNRWISLGQYHCEAAGQNFVLVTNEETQGHVVADAVQYLAVDNERADDASSPATGDGARDSPPAVARLRDRWQRLEAELNERKKSVPARPRVMTIVERDEIGDAALHVRGSVHTLGDVVPRGFLQVMDFVVSRPVPATESGRRELAEWIACAENPLTARVMSNRIWHWLMGKGLVRTVDNFGTTGEAPTHPELLDHLAARFVADGWSVKCLVRYIVLSAAYRRSSQDVEAGMRMDPENRLLWRSNRKRLEAESLRDAMLSIAGQLDLRASGPTIRPGVAADFDYVDRSVRRSVYVPVLRNSLPELFDVFDFADPSMVVGRRNRSTVAPQALYMLNSPFVREQAAAAAERMLAEWPASDEQAIALAFRQTLGRAPNADEERLARQALAIGATESPRRAWTDLYQILFASLDFRYCD